MANMVTPITALSMSITELDKEVAAIQSDMATKEKELAELRGRFAAFNLLRSASVAIIQEEQRKEKEREEAQPSVQA